MARRWFVAALLLTAAASVILLLAPLSSEQNAGGAVERRSLLAAEGPGVAVLLAVPLLVCALPVLIPRPAVAWGSAALLAAGVLVGLASVGLYYLPVLALLVAGAWRRGSAAPSRR